MKKILIVDDDSDIVELVQNRLQGNRYEVFTANDGEEGIRKAQKIKPDLIIMDVVMPNMPGGDAVRYLRSDEDTKHIPVLFLTVVTADMPEGKEERGINVEGQFYSAISKPFDREKLLYKVKKLLEGSQPISN